MVQCDQRQMGEPIVGPEFEGCLGLENMARCGKAQLRVRRELRRADTQRSGAESTVARGAATPRAGAGGGSTT
jgi:hypothetical protein